MALGGDNITLEIKFTWTLYNFKWLTMYIQSPHNFVLHFSCIFSLHKWQINVYLHDTFRQSHCYEHGTYFTNDILLVIEIQWKSCLPYTNYPLNLIPFHVPFVIIGLLQIFAHATTAWLSWHVQNFVAISSLVFRWEYDECSIKFGLWWKKSCVKWAHIPGSIVIAGKIAWLYAGYLWSELMAPNAMPISLTTINSWLKTGLKPVCC